MLKRARRQGFAYVKPMRLQLTGLALVAGSAALVVACSGGADTEVGSPDVQRSAPTPTTEPKAEKVTNVEPSATKTASLEKPVVTPTAALAKPKGVTTVVAQEEYSPSTPAAGTAKKTGPTPTPFPTPQAIKIGEEETAVLVDDLPYEDHPRVSARQMVSDYRKDAEAAKAKHQGNSYVMDGKVEESGVDDKGLAFVTFKVGRGHMRCVFKAISEAELSRLTPGGSNAVVGIVQSFDESTLTVHSGECQVVKGF